MGLFDWAWLQYMTGKSTAQKSRRYGHGEVRTPKDIKRERAMHTFNIQHQELIKRMKDDNKFTWW